MIGDYFAAETAKLEGAVIKDIRTKEDWLGRKDELRRQLYEMLGLDPLPERTPLNPVVTGTLDHPEFTVEKLHFQSRPKLYVTANLYIPKGLKKPAPAVLYVCGHGNERTKDNVSLGSKTKYQHHGAWLARQGYVCLILDTLQLAEIEGLHHGTYHKDMFWWYSRGYTPAGVEAWNGIRALDYLQSRKEVDPERLGVTGRSGGGASSWWIAALDERVKAAVPVAGITDLRNHVVDGVIEGHCDCMFQINTYGWDYGTLAALIAPRPLLLSNTDDDRIFPLDGVERVHWQTRKIYGLLGAAKDLGLQISWGGHLDTQELQVAALRWLNLHLKKADPKIEIAAVKMFEPAQLKVFDKLPEDELNTTAHEWFVPMAAKPKVPADASEWATMRDAWRTNLDEKVFRGWRAEAVPLEEEERRSRSGRKLAINLTFESDSPFELTVLADVPREGKPAKSLRLLVAADDGYSWTLSSDPSATSPANAGFTPRGLGHVLWDQTPKRQTQHQRRFMLLGQTLAGQQVYDIRRAIQALHTLPELKDAKVTLVAEGPMAALAVYAALYEPSVDRLELTNVPRSHMPKDSASKDFAPALLNVLKYLDLPQAVAMAAVRATVVIYDDEPAKWQYPVDVAKALGWKDRVVLEKRAK
ncbi:MAG: acetylxylan esterase [Pirellula sp.]|nr:acetylxylan esterase [Pirellula sp.]